jgi:hypothetical protein
MLVENKKSHAKSVTYAQSPQIIAQLPATGGMPQFPQCFCLDLPYALARNIEKPAYFFQCMIPAIHQTEA